MTDSDTGPHRRILQRIARRAVRDRGLLPDFSRKVLDELDHIHRPASCMEEELSANVERGYIHSTKAGQSRFLPHPETASSPGGISSSFLDHRRTC